jgi:hypothetical protein
MVNAAPQKAAFGSLNASKQWLCQNQGNFAKDAPIFYR